MIEEHDRLSDMALEEAYERRLIREAFEAADEDTERLKQEEKTS